MAVGTADLNTVYSLLRNSLSQDEAVRKPSEATLSALESLPGFCTCLLEIISAQNLEDRDEARWLAILYFKNSIFRYWRTRRDSPGITAAEKPYLRRRLLELIREENRHIAIQLAVLISKIARFDYPREWQELFPTLLQKLQSSDMLTTHRVYMVLHQVLKELSSKRLAVDQQNFAHITSQLFNFTWAHWCADTQTILRELSSMTQNSGDSGELSFMLERWILCLKILGRMIHFGFPSDLKSVQEVPPVKQVCPAFLQCLQSLLQFRLALRPEQALYKFADSACLKLLKTLCAVQTTHPYSFSDKTVLPSVLDFACQQILQQNPDDRGCLFEPFLIQSMLFVRQVLQCEAYRANKRGRVLGQTTPTLDDARHNLSKQAEQILKQLMNNDKILQLCQTLVTRGFVYTSKDLEAWASNAEAFHHEEGLTHSREKLRPCSEALYLALWENHRELLGPFVVQHLKQASAECPSPAPDADVQLTPALLTKDAAYNAVGLSPYHLHNCIDFKLWYDGALELELMNVHPNNRILRRRIAWLFGEWVDKIKDDLRRPVYVGLLRLLADGDMAVQLAALHSLTALIDDLNFHEEAFAEMLPTALDLLVQFMDAAQEFESKVQVFYTITTIIDRLKEKILPCTEKLLIFLPQVWRTSEGEMLLRIQVILAMQHLVSALGAMSPTCYKLLLPVLEHVIDPKHPDEIHVLEDGLQLWKTTVRCAPAMIPGLLALFPHALVAIEKSFDHLQVIMQITESYVLLGGVEFFAHHAGAVLSIFKRVIGQVNERGMLCTLPVLDITIQCFPAQAPSLLEEVLRVIFVMVVSAKDEPDVVKAAACAVLARVLVQNFAFFGCLSASAALSHSLQQAGVSANQSSLLLFLDVLLDKMDAQATMCKRKVCALALCMLLSVRETQILDRLEQILSVCTSVLHEAEDERNGVTSGVWGGTTCSEDGFATESEDARKRQIMACDPVAKCVLGPLLKEKLQQCAALHGDAAFTAALASVAPSLLSDLQQL